MKKLIKLANRQIEDIEEKIEELKTERVELMEKYKAKEGDYPMSAETCLNKLNQTTFKIHNEQSKLLELQIAAKGLEDA